MFFGQNADSEVLPHAAADARSPGIKHNPLDDEMWWTSCVLTMTSRKIQFGERDTRLLQRIRCFRGGFLHALASVFSAFPDLCSCFLPSPLACARRLLGSLLGVLKGVLGCFVGGVCDIFPSRFRAPRGIVNGCPRGLACR